MTHPYISELYDISSAGSIDGDIEFYLELAQQSGGPILELGAGTGRVLLPIAKAGIPITGLDLDTGMLARLRRRVVSELPLDKQAYVTVLEGNMQDFALETRFAVVQIPFRAFLHNITREQQVACLSCCFNHLAPGGVLAFNVFHPSLSYMSNNQGAFEGLWRWVGEYNHPDGGFVVCSEANRYNTARQTLSSRHRFEHFDASGHLLGHAMHRLELAYLYPGDIRELLAATGFVDVSISGDFDGEPFTQDGQELVVLARRPALDGV